MPLNKINITELGIEGYVQYIDHFGNIITNIPSSYIAGKTWSVVIKKDQNSALFQTIASGNTYTDCKPGELIAIVGSHGFIEIVANASNAQSQLNLKYGDPYKLTFNISQLFVKLLCEII